MNKEHRLPQLGLVCITFSDAVRYRALTRKRWLQFEIKEREAMLRDLYRDNLTRFDNAIDFCVEHQIKLYRLTSAFFPFADTDIGAGVLVEVADDAGRVGEKANRSGLRVVLHPDQFCVLSSDSPSVIENSILILATHARIFDVLKLPRTSWAAMNIHGGKADRSARLISVIKDLPDAVRSRLTFENDEHTYSSAQILEVCGQAGVPMMFDAHHHVCREKLTSYEDASVKFYTDAARETWRDNQDWQMVHLSNGREYFYDAKHSDLIIDVPRAFDDARLWIEVEAKHKELAIGGMRDHWQQLVGAQSQTGYWSKQE